MLVVYDIWGRGKEKRGGGLNAEFAEVGPQRREKREGGLTLRHAQGEKPLLRFGGGVGRCGIVVHTAAGFAAEAALLDVLAEERAGFVFFTESGVEIFEDFQTDIEADEIDHFKRAHRVIEAELHGFIDVSGGGDACFEHSESFVADKGVDARGDEAGGFADDHSFLAHLRGDGYAGGNGFVGGLRCANNFYELHFGDRVEKVHPDAAVAMEDDVAEITDGEGGSVASKDGVGHGEFVEDGEEFQLHLELFGDGFDDELGATDGFVYNLRSGDSGQGGVSGGGVQFAAANAFVEGLADPCRGFREHGVGDVFENGVVPSESGGVGDATAHGAGADDGDGLNWHAKSSSNSRPTQKTAATKMCWFNAGPGCGRRLRRSR